MKALVSCYGLMMIIGLQSCKQPMVSAQFVQNGIAPPAYERDYWPTQSWQHRPASQTGLQQDHLDQALNFAFAEGKSTDAMVVIKNGYLVAERYRQPYKRKSRHYLWSIAKSVTDALIGRAEYLGLLHRSQKISQFMPEFGKDALKSEMTIDHLLRMESGIEWQETYEYNPLFSNVLAMLYGQGSKAMGAYVAQQPARFEPGQALVYSSGSSNLLCMILRAAFASREQYSSFPWQQLFQKIGVSSAVWEQDASGSFVCSSYLFMTARDLARFGFLYLNNGNWDGERIFSDTWVYTATTDTLCDRSPDYRYAYGSSWYLNFDRADARLARYLPAVPAKTFWASGHWGQFLVIVPELDLLVVRFGDDRRSRFPLDEFFQRLLGKT